MRYLYLDTESRCTLPISVGTDLYTLNAECTLVQWKWATDPTWGDDWVDYWEPLKDIGVPRELALALADPSVIVVAHNAVHDRLTLRRSLRLDVAIPRWRCTLAQASAHSLPGSLEALGEALDVPKEKRKRADDGNTYGPLFWAPKPGGGFNDRNSHPEEWEKFIGYGQQDVVALQAVHERMPAHNYVGAGLALYHLNEKINERGFGFDRELAEGSVEIVKKAKERQNREVKRLTFGAVEKATQGARLLDHLNQTGHEFENMRAATIRAKLKDPNLDSSTKDLLELRLEANKSASSKYKRALTMLSPDGRLRQTMKYCGAGRTGRFSGRGFQPHNLKRPTWKAPFIEYHLIPRIKDRSVLDFYPICYGTPQEAVGQSLRGAIVAAEGYELVVADWSNIESRVLAWLCGEEWKLEAYRAIDAKLPGAVDLYRLLYALMFGGNPEDVDDNQRQGGKVSELAFGFGGGVGALVTMSAGYNMDMSKIPAMVLPRAEAEQLKGAARAYWLALRTGKDYELEADVYMACDILKQGYRAANPNINQGRYDLYQACLNALTEGGAHLACKCTVWRAGGFLIIQLPSGRRLFYPGAIAKGEVVEDPLTGKKQYRAYISVMAARKGGWYRERLTPLTTIENIAQAVANDVLRGGMLRLDARWPDSIVLDVHDEIVAEVPKGTIQLSDYIDELTRPFNWSAGLPLAAAGWIGPRYKKA